LQQFIYYFSVHVVKALGMREDSVLQINLLGEGGIAGGTVQRWRGGASEAADSRPLSTLLRIEADAAAPSALRLHFRTTDGKASSMHLVARSASDRSTIIVLLTTLTSGEPAAGSAPPLRLRHNDELMPPAPRLAARLTMRQSGGSLLGGRPSVRVFAMLGRSKLLIFGEDQSLSNLKQLISLETGALQVSHVAGEKELELSLPSATGAAKGGFKMTLGAETPYVAGQWAQQITEGLLQQGLFAAASPLPAAPVRASDGGGAAMGGGVSMGGGDPFEAPPVGVAAADAPRRWTSGPSAGGVPPSAAGSEPAVGDLLGDLSSPGNRRTASHRREASGEISTMMRELCAVPTRCRRNEPCACARAGDETPMAAAEADLAELAELADLRPPPLPPHQHAAPLPPHPRPAAARWSGTASRAPRQRAEQVRRGQVGR
jgi:hypothetical protein